MLIRRRELQKREHKFGLKKIWVDLWWSGWAIHIKCFVCFCK